MDFDSTEFKNGIKQVVQFLMEAEEGAKDLEKVLSALNIDLDTEETKKALSDIESILIDIDKTDLSEIVKTLNELQQGNLDENIQNLDKALKEMDASKFDKEVEKLAESFLRARQETEQLVVKKKLALQAFLKGEKPFGWNCIKIKREVIIFILFSLNKFYFLTFIMPLEALINLEVFNSVASK